MGPTRGDEVGPNVVAVVDLVTGDELVDIDGPGQLDSDGLKVLVTAPNVLALRDSYPFIIAVDLISGLCVHFPLTPEEAQTNLSHYRQAGRAVRLGRGFSGRDRSSPGRKSRGSKALSALGRRSTGTAALMTSCGTGGDDRPS